MDELYSELECIPSDQDSVVDELECDELECDKTKLMNITDCE